MGQATRFVRGSSSRPHPAVLYDRPAYGSASLRVGAVSSVASLLLEAGQPVSTVLHDAGLWGMSFRDSERRLTYSQSENLFSSCEWHTGDIQFGLKVGQRTYIDHLGAVGEFMRSAATVGEAINRFVGNYHQLDTIATYILDVDGSSARLTYALTVTNSLHTRHFHLYGIALACSVLLALCGQNWVPTNIRVATKVPALGASRKLLGVRIGFDAVESSVTFPIHWLRRSLAPVSTSAEYAVGPHCLEDSSRCLVTIVLKVMRELLAAGSFSMDDVARRLSIHRRTLDRRLSDRGCKYGTLLAALRSEAARQLLRETDAPIPDIADAVRFSTAANFSTAFRRCVGMSPRAYRYMYANSKTARHACNKVGAGLPLDSSARS